MRTKEKYGKSIYGLFQETVNKYRNSAAIIENKRTMTFGELSDMVDMIADSFPDHTMSRVNMGQMP